MPEIEFDGQTISVNNDTSYPVGKRLDWSVAITDYELRQVASTLPPGKSLPVALRSGSADPGDMVDPVLVLVPTASDMAALVALARMRDCRTGPHYPEGMNGAQEADQAQDEPVPAPGSDRRLERAADDMQATVERALGNMEVDPVKYDHQNRAGDLVGALLAVLRRHDYLPEPVDEPLPPNAWRVTRDYYLSHHQDVRAAVAKGISTASLSSLREAQRIGQLVMEHLDALFESRGVAR